MPSPADITLRETIIRLLYGVLRTPYKSLSLITSDPYRARSMILRIKAELGDEELKPIKVEFSPNNTEGELWLVIREDTNNENETTNLSSEIIL